MVKQEIIENLYYVGVNDRKKELFERYIPLTNGVSYNSYLIKDKKNTLIDTVDSEFKDEFIENIKCVLGDEKLHYLIINHMEPDHAGSIIDVIKEYPEVTVIGSALIFKMIDQFFTVGIKNKILIKEGDTIETGTFKLQCIQAPMVHWPEVTMLYEINNKILFSTDGFGSFNAINGTLFYDEAHDSTYMDEYRRYYTNIVGKFGKYVNDVLKKASTLDIKMICPLHGYIIRENIGYFVEKYIKFANYDFEDKEVIIIYASIYNNTSKAASRLATLLSNEGIKNTRVYDASFTDFTYLLSETFRVSNIVIMSPSYNLDIFPKLDIYLSTLRKQNVSNKSFSLIENGTWSSNSNKLIEDFITNNLNNCKVLSNKLTINSSLKETQIDQLKNIAKEIKKDMDAKK